MLFKEIGELDYILVTVKANITRWTNNAFKIMELKLKNLVNI